MSKFMQNLLNPCQTFEHYPDLPPELRMMVIDEMEAEDKGRFSSCSTSCNKESKASKRYIFELAFRAFQTGIEIKVFYNDCRHAGYKLNFGINSQIMKCLKISGEELWEENLDTSSEEYGIKHFETLLKNYQNNIRSLEIDTKKYDRNVDFFNGQIEKLGRLKKLRVDGEHDIRPLLSKLRQPLDVLEFIGKSGREHLANYEKIYEVRQKVLLYPENLTAEQLTRLAAHTVLLAMGQLTEKDIFKFIQSWRNGTIGKRIEHYQWVLEKSNFDKQELMRLLGLNSDEENIDTILENKHGEKMRLQNCRCSLKFHTPDCEL